MSLSCAAASCASAVISCAWSVAELLRSSAASSADDFAVLECVLPDVLHGVGRRRQLRLHRRNGALLRLGFGEQHGDECAETECDSTLQ